jgi:hypothetical protein
VQNDEIAIRYIDFDIGAEYIPDLLTSLSTSASVKTSGLIEHPETALRRAARSSASFTKIQIRPQRRVEGSNLSFPLAPHMCQSPGTSRSELRT